MDIKDVGSIIHNRRKELGLTLDDVGKYVGMNKSTVLRWERGDFATLKRGHMYLLSKILYLPIETLLGLDTDKDIESSEITKLRLSLIEKINLLEKGDLEQVDKFIKDWLKK